MTLTKCGICDGVQDAMREHCRFCGSRRAFIAHHSYEQYQIVVQARNADNLAREVVRAYQTNIAFQMVTK